MLIYGICMSEIKDSEIDWDKVEKLLESYDSSLHRDFKEYVNYDDSETPEEQEYWKKEWFLAYDSMGYHGLGAFLHDVIKKEKTLTLIWEIAMVLSLVLPRICHGIIRKT